MENRKLAIDPLGILTVVCIFICVKLSFRILSLYEWNLWVELLAIAFAFIFHQIVTAFGTYVSGRLLGYKFISITLFGLEWVKFKGRMVLKRSHTPNIVSLCHMRPKNFYADARRETIFSFSKLIPSLIFTLPAPILYLADNDIFSKLPPAVLSFLFTPAVLGGMFVAMQFFCVLRNIYYGKINKKNQSSFMKKL